MGEAAVKHGNPAIDLANVQGLVRWGYRQLRCARFQLFTIDDPTEARRWLGSLELTSASPRQDQPGRRSAERPAVNLALTHEGMVRLGLDDHALDSFSEQLITGMTASHRRRILGDHGDSDPDHWLWGGRGDAVHGVLLLYARSTTELHELIDRCWDTETGVRGVPDGAIDTRWLPDDREHFGFRDGMGQPRFAGIQTDQVAPDVLAAGELLLGYRNQYGGLPHGPILARHSDALGGRDFGKDGSYLVIRQLAQDVAGFWSFARRAAEQARIAQRLDVTGDPAIALAAKMVGRWPGGAPLAMSPHRDDPALADANDFLYGERGPGQERDDRLGLGCPYGSHVRRANPRDWLLGEDPASSQLVADRHRILRRGRAYGLPLSDSMQPADLMTADPDGTERGLVFACLNANIERQFEFVQHTWMNNPVFGGLHGGADPLLGDHQPETTARRHRASFVIPADPVRVRINDMERFVRVRGGAYFFLPSLRAVRHLASL